MTKDIFKVLLLIDTSMGSGRKLLYGISQYSRLHGPWSFNRKSVYFSDYQTEFSKHLPFEEEAVSKLEKWGPDGVIATNINYAKQFNRILKMGLPCLILGGYEPRKKTANWHRVRSNSLSIGKMAAEHLLDRGYRHFAYVGYHNLTWSRERKAGFARRINEAGYTVSSFKAPRPQTKRFWENEQTALADWLKSLPKPLGLMAGNDDGAQNVLEACKIGGLKVPDEIAVIGVDNDILVCEVSEPPVSSIMLNNEMAGFEASKLLLRLMSGEKIAHQEIVVEPTGIVVRESTDHMAIDNVNVSTAIRFIRQHASEMIHVGDVVDRIPISRRSLERDFRRILGRSIFAEIKRVHVAQFAKMLLETNMTVSQIALALGHSNIQNINRYFREEMGMSPTAYRKKHGLLLTQPLSAEV